MEQAWETLYTHTDKEGRTRSWRVHLYEEQGLPAAVVVLPLPAAGNAGVGLLMETAPLEVARILARIEGTDQCCWWIEQDPGAGEWWAAACFDGKSVLEIRHGDL